MRFEDNSMCENYKIPPRPQGPVKVNGISVPLLGTGTVFAI